MVNTGVFSSIQYGTGANENTYGEGEKPKTLNGENPNTLKGENPKTLKGEKPKTLKGENPNTPNGVKLNCLTVKSIGSS